MSRATELQDQLLAIAVEIARVDRERAAVDEKRTSLIEERASLKARHLALLSTLERAADTDSDLRDDGIERMRGTLRRIRRNSVRETVMRAIADNGGTMTRDAIATATGLAPGTVAMALQDAKRPKVALVQGPDEKREWSLTLIGEADLEYRRERGAD